MEKYIRTSLEEVIARIRAIQSAEYIPESSCAIAHLLNGNILKVEIDQANNGNVRADIFDAHGKTIGTVFQYRYFKNNYKGNYPEIGDGINTFVESVLDRSGNSGRASGSN